MDSAGSGKAEGVLSAERSTEQPTNKTAVRNKITAVRFKNLLLCSILLTSLMSTSKSNPTVL
jgi:hypothetical protein